MAKIQLEDKGVDLYHLLPQIELIESIQQKEISNCGLKLVKRTIIELSNISLLMASNYRLQLILKAAGFIITNAEIT